MTKNEQVAKIIEETFGLKVSKGTYERIKRTYEERPELRELVREQMKKRSAAGKNRAFLESCHKAKPVVCVETGEVFPSASAAEKGTGFAGVHKACSGKQFLSGGYHWRWAEKRPAG